MNFSWVFFFSAAFFFHLSAFLFLPSFSFLEITCTEFLYTHTHTQARCRECKKAARGDDSRGLGAETRPGAFKVRCDTEKWKRTNAKSDFVDVCVCVYVRFIGGIKGRKVIYVCMCVFTIFFFLKKKASFFRSESQKSVSKTPHFSHHRRMQRIHRDAETRQRMLQQELKKDASMKLRASQMDDQAARDSMRDSEQSQRFENSLNSIRREQTLRRMYDLEREKDKVRAAGEVREAQRQREVARRDAAAAREAQVHSMAQAATDLQRSREVQRRENSASVSWVLVVVVLF